MTRIIIVMIAVLSIATGASARNYVYHDASYNLESDGYKLFASEDILNTVEHVDGAAAGANYCARADENTEKYIGDISAVRSDKRLPIDANAKISYSAACGAYSAVIKRLTTADDVRKLWLLFADSATDEYVEKMLNQSGAREDAVLSIEMKRLATVSEYIEFFYRKNKEWKLTDYTFLSQAFKSRKGKPLSPAFSRFIAALLTGDAEMAFRVVTSIDLDNLGRRFTATGASDSVNMRESPASLTSRQ